MPFPEILSVSLSFTARFIVSSVYPHTQLCKLMLTVLLAHRYLLKHYNKIAVDVMDREFILPLRQSGCFLLCNCLS